MSMVHVEMLRPHLSLRKGQKRRMAKRLADRLVKAKIARLIEAPEPTTRRAKPLIENKSLGA